MIQEAYEAYEAKFRDVLHEAKIFFADVLLSVIFQLI
jgi:hypothetical protein